MSHGHRLSRLIGNSIEHAVAEFVGRGLDVETARWAALMRAEDRRDQLAAKCRRRVHGIESPHERSLDMIDLISDVISGPPLNHELLAPIAKMEMCDKIGDGLTCACVMHMAAIVDAARRGGKIEPTDRVLKGCVVVRAIAVNLNDLAFWRDECQRKTNLLPIIEPIVNDPPPPRERREFRRAVHSFNAAVIFAADAMRTAGQVAASELLESIEPATDCPSLRVALDEMKRIRQFITDKGHASNALTAAMDSGKSVEQGVWNHASDRAALAAFNATRVGGMHIKQAVPGDERSIAGARKLIKLLFECLAID